VLIERSPVATTSTLGSTVQRVVAEANTAREAGDTNWWRRLEAALAAVGSQADNVMECIQDEVEAGKPKPVDVEYLLANVIPALLRLSGSSISNLRIAEIN
jgi:importin-9